jgi:hypothetical protein
MPEANPVPLRHLDFSNRANRQDYTARPTGGGPDFSVYPQQRAAHARKLQQELQVVEVEAERLRLSAELAPYVEDVGINIVVRSEVIHAAVRNDERRETGNVWLSIADLLKAEDNVVVDSKEYVSDKGAEICKLVTKGTLLVSFKLTLSPSPNRLNRHMWHILVLTLPPVFEKGFKCGIIKIA